MDSEPIVTFARTISGGAAMLIFVTMGFIFAMVQEICSARWPCLCDFRAFEAHFTNKKHGTQQFTPRGGRVRSISLLRADQYRFCQGQSVLRSMY